MTTLFDSTRPVKPDRTFGRGLLPSLEDLMPHAGPDLQDADSIFADDDCDDASLEERAQQAAWDDQFAGYFPTTGRGLLCGRPSHDLDMHGLCDPCSDLACNATIAGENGRAGLGYRVF
jgi:hypothetical protein